MERWHDQGMSLESLKSFSTVKDRERIIRFSGHTAATLDGIHSKPNSFKKLKLDDALPLISLFDDISVLETIYRLDRRVAVQHAIREHPLYRLFEHSLRCVKGCTSDFSSLEIGIKNGFCDEVLFQWVNNQGVDPKMYWEILLQEGKCSAEAHIESALGNFPEDLSLPPVNTIGESWKQYRLFKKAFDSLTEITPALVPMALKYDIDLGKYQLSPETALALLKSGSTKYIFNLGYFEEELLLEYFSSFSEEDKVNMLCFASDSLFIEKATELLSEVEPGKGELWDKLLPKMEKLPELSSNARQAIFSRFSPSLLAEFITGSTKIVPRSKEVTSILNKYVPGTNALIPELRRGKFYLTEPVLEFCAVASEEVRPVQDLLMARSSVIATFINQKTSVLKEDELAMFFSLFESWGGSLEELLSLVKSSALKSNATSRNAVTVIK